MICSRSRSTVVKMNNNMSKLPGRIDVGLLVIDEQRLFGRVPRRSSVSW